MNSPALGWSASRQQGRVPWYSSSRFDEHYQHATLDILRLNRCFALTHSSCRWHRWIDSQSPATPHFQHPTKNAAFCASSTHRRELRSGRRTILRAAQISTGRQRYFNGGHVRWSIPRASGTPIEERHLITPPIPAPPFLTGKQFEVRSSRQPLYAIVNLIRLAAVLASRLNDQTLYIFRETRWRTSSR